MGFVLAAAGCASFVEIPVEIPIQSKFDVSAFQRVLIAGFLPAGSKSIDPNTETARLLRSQLRSKQDLRVIDSDAISLVDAVNQQRTGAGTAAPSTPGAAKAAVLPDAQTLASYQGIFKDAGFWKKIGDEYDHPLIVTGSVVFDEITKSGEVSRPQAYRDAEGHEQYRSVRQVQNMKGYSLSPTFIFIDGRTGEQLYTETYHEEALYPPDQNTPALSSYFELMDKLLPSFLNTLSTQKIRGTRVLLK
ncbi:MAG TPA: hypothetical protein VHD57_10700 [Vicinamibacterales bacterium]|nr:hypothetical protein [Vicinamibacterales bacterium]